MEENGYFLSKDEVAFLTGWKNPKKQAAHLRSLGLVFFVNARGFPVVPRSAISGNLQAKNQTPNIKWQPST